MLFCKRRIKASNLWGWYESGIRRIKVLVFVRGIWAPDCPHSFLFYEGSRNDDRNTAEKRSGEIRLQGRDKKSSETPFASVLLLTVGPENKVCVALQYLAYICSFPWCLCWTITQLHRLILCLSAHSDNFAAFSVKAFTPSQLRSYYGARDQTHRQPAHHISKEKPVDQNDHFYCKIVIISTPAISMTQPNATTKQGKCTVVNV